MSFLDRFFKPNSPPPVVHQMAVGVRAPGLLKLGKWVIHSPTGQPGILNGAEAFPEVDVMLVNEAGENYRQERCRLDQIRVARLLEIPAARRPTPEAGASLGYF
jgi:hypothetical protein